MSQRPDPDEPSVVYMGVPRGPRWRELAARVRPVSRRALGWLLGLATLTLAGFLSLVIYAAVSGH